LRCVSAEEQYQSLPQEDEPSISFIADWR